VAMHDPPWRRDYDGCAAGRRSKGYMSLCNWAVCPVLIANDVLCTMPFVGLYTICQPLVVLEHSREHRTCYLGFVRCFYKAKIGLCRSIRGVKFVGILKS